MDENEPSADDEPIQEQVVDQVELEESVAETSQPEISISPDFELDVEPEIEVEAVAEKDIKQEQEPFIPVVTRSATPRANVALESEDEMSEEQETALPIQVEVISSVSPKEIENLQLTKRYGLRDADPKAFKLVHNFGFQSHKRCNIHYIEETVILSSMGNLLIFMNLKTGDCRYIEGVREGSIGALAVHPTRQYIAVGEMCKEEPNIYIYRYPQMTLTKILRGGAEKGYSDLAFNTAGTKIASVATDPDYMLTIWNWDNSVILLRSKAFSQDVYRVRFSPDNDGILTTSGMGHIKFWRMSSTFTGLKLQGYLGKFGASELSDIASFMQLPDGKVLSSTETGNLLLWDGGMIKCEIGVKGKKCHQGRIEVILLGEGEIITAGEDGFVRIWDLETIDNADVISTSEGGSSIATARVFEIEPLDEILISKDVKIKCLIRNPTSPQDYIVQNQQGQLLKLDLNKRSTEKFHSFHSGPVKGISASPSTHVMTTIGSDGFLRSYNYLTRQFKSKVHYSQGGTCLQYLPTALDGVGRTVVAGFQDGVVRFVCIGATSFLLQYVFKPSKAAITAISFSGDGLKMAVASADKTIFLFNLVIKKDGRGAVQAFARSTVAITPIGYFDSFNVVNSLSFATEDEIVPLAGKKVAHYKRLNATTIDGELLTLMLASDATFDNTTSFDITNSLKISKWKPTVPERMVVAPMQDPNDKQDIISDQLRKAPSNAILVTQSKFSNSLNSLRKQKGLNFNSNAIISCTLSLSYSYFVAAVLNQDDESEIRIFHHTNPGFSLLLGVVTDQISFLNFDLARNHILAGTSHGACVFIKFSLLQLPFDIRDPEGCPSSHETYAEHVNRFELRIKAAIKEMQADIPELDINHPPANCEVDGQQWTGHLHDIVHGSITGIATSFDSSFFMSTGSDGGIFVWRHMLSEIDQVSNDDDIDAQLLIAPIVEDITELTAYSIQEEKIKSEQDREIEAAGSQKQMIRNQILELRKEYNLVMQENSAAPKSITVDPAELVVDPYLKDDIGREAEKRKEHLTKELAWETERESIGPAKLIKKFLDPLQTESIQIKAFKADYLIATFRTLKTNQHFTSIIQPLIHLAERTSGGKEVLDELADGRKTAGFDFSTPSAPKGPKKNQSSVKKLEARKQFRAERATHWKQLMDSKPDDKYQDPNDVAAIRYATAHMGDYKLKSADNFIVPENERVDADKKKRQILLLNESIRSLKEQFNEKVFRMRAKKVKLIGEFTAINSKLGNINIELLEMKEIAALEAPYLPILETGIFPEQRFIVTEEDIKNLKEEEIANAANSSKKGDDGMGFGTGTAAPQKESSKANTVRPDDSGSKPSTAESTSSGKKDDDPIDVKVKKINLHYQKNRISKGLESSISEFDKTIEHLANERILLSGDLKFADIKLQLLFREWMLLKEFEQTDNKLAEKVNAKKAEKDEIDSKIDDYREKLSTKKLETESVIRKEKEIHEEYRKAIGENNKNEEYMTKVFKRKVKRTKKKVKEENEGDDEEEVDSDSDLSSYNSDNDESQEFEEEIPSECEQAIWNKVIELREKRLDQEEILNEVQKTVENDSLIKKEKIIDAAMKKAESEIEDFQTLKQRKLNELDVIVPLRLSQIQHPILDGPVDLTTHLVFYNEGLAQLKRRIKELHQEKNDIKKQHKELRKQHVSFSKSKKEKEERVAELSEKANDVQMLKFGQIVDLEKLEKLGVNKAADELKEKLSRDDRQRLREVADMDTKIREEKEKYMTIVKHNTEHLEQIVELQRQKQNLEKTLDFSQSVLARTELSGPNKKEAAEKRALLTLVQTQSAHIEEIKAEIENLIRKPMAKSYVRQVFKQEEPMLPTRIIREKEEMDSVALDGASLAAE